MADIELKSTIFATETKLAGLYAASRSLGTPHTLAAMASPPTLTVTNSAAQPSGLTVAYPVIGGSALPRYKGGGSTALATIYRQFPVTTDPSGGIAGGAIGVIWEMSIKTNSPKVAFYITGSGSQGYRLLVQTPGEPAQYVSKAESLASANGYIVLDFGGEGDRIVTLQGEGTAAVTAVNVSTGYVITRPLESDELVLFLGDSFTAGSGVTYPGDGYAKIAGELLGFSNIWMSGSGGTGYVANNTGSRLKLADRIVADVNRAKAAGAVSKVFVAMGLNDIPLNVPAQVGTEANICFDDLRTLLPVASISVISPWDKFAPATPLANHLAVDAAIRAAAVGRPGFRYLDLTGTPFTKSDGTHPDEAGAMVLAKAVAEAERIALMAA